MVSFGRGCAEPNQYGVYTSVPFYATWINQYTSGFLQPGQIVPAELGPVAVAPDGRVMPETLDEEEEKANIGSVDWQLLLTVLLLIALHRLSLFRAAKPQAAQAPSSCRLKTLS